MRCPTSWFLLLSLAACASPSRPPTDPDLVTTPNGRTVASLQRAAYDAAHHGETCKVFHHVFAPDGRLLTKGLGGEFEHHRGLFLGWNQMQWQGEAFDFWHCRKGESQQFVAFAVDDAAPAADGWQVVTIDWRTAHGASVLQERRALQARELDAETTVLQVRSELRATSTPVRLDGDPQHAGQQFRALQQFAEKGSEPVQYLRPAAATGGKDDVWTGCRWTAAVLPMPGGPVTVLRVEGAGNPGPTRWSTRPYGRFGATFRTELLPDQPRSLTWSYAIALGARDLPWCERTAASLGAR